MINQFYLTLRRQMKLKYLGDQDLDKLGYPDKALKVYDDAIEINPQDSEVWYKKSILSIQIK